MFKDFYLTGKGYIVREELEELCFGLGITKEESNAIFDDLDNDLDGKISYADFSLGFQEFLLPEEQPTTVPSHNKTPNPHHSLHRRRASMWYVTIRKWERIQNSKLLNVSL